MKTRTLPWMVLAGLIVLAACTANTGPEQDCVMNPDENQLVCAGPVPEVAP